MLPFQTLLLQCVAVMSFVQVLSSWLMPHGSARRHIEGASWFAWFIALFCQCAIFPSLLMVRHRRHPDEWRTVVFCVFIGYFVKDFITDMSLLHKLHHLICIGASFGILYDAIPVCDQFVSALILVEISNALNSCRIIIDGGKRWWSLTFYCVSYAHVILLGAAACQSWFMVMAVKGGLLTSIFALFVYMRQQYVWVGYLESLRSGGPVNRQTSCPVA